MSDTSASLLERLHAQPDDADWRRLVELYAPLIRGWLRRQGVGEADAEDVSQEVLTVVVRRFPDFSHNQRRGAFRAWLRAITANCLRDFWRAQRLRPAAHDFAGLLDQLSDDDSAQSRVWDREHDLHVARRLLELIQGDFAPTTWEAFRRVALEGAAADAVAADLGLTVNAVFIAKSRVLSRLRQEAAGLLDDGADS
jgi:RNA polymerase sigma-70 factor (ECF subfamily)